MTRNTNIDLINPFIHAISLLAAVILILTTPAPAAPPDQPAGRLKIEGKHIEYLVLIGSGHDRREFNRPEGVLTLPAGNYHWEQITLQGGFYAHRLYDNFLDEFTVKPDETTVVKIGGPLNPSVNVTRQGKTLQLDYVLRGIGGETYADGSREKPPRFEVYHGDRKIGGADFEYG